MNVTGTVPGCGAAAELITRTATKEQAGHTDSMDALGKRAFHVLVE